MKRKQLIGTLSQVRKRRVRRLIAYYYKGGKWYKVKKVLQ